MEEVLIPIPLIIFTTSTPIATYYYNNYNCIVLLSIIVRELPIFQIENLIRHIENILVIKNLIRQTDADDIDIYNSTIITSKWKKGSYIQLDVRHSSYRRRLNLPGNIFFLFYFYIYTKH